MRLKITCKGWYAIELNWCIATYNYTYTYTCGNMINNNDEQTHFFRKIFLSHFIRKCWERVAKGVVCARWVGDWTDCNILTPSSSDYSSTSFSFCWAAQPGVLRAQALCWELVLTGSNCNLNFNCNWLQLNDRSVAPGYIIVWCPPTSSGCRNYTEFNPSTVKVISWYLPPDAPVSWLTAGSKVNMLHNQLNIKITAIPYINNTVENIGFFFFLSNGRILFQCARGQYSTNSKWVRT